MEDLSPFEFIATQIARLTWTDREKIRPEARFIDFGLDSVKAMDLIVELEQAYDIEIADKDLADLTTLQDVADYVERRRSGE